MILVADSGSTKTDWIAVNDNEKIEESTMGFNPFLHATQNIVDGIKSSDKLHSIAQKVTDIHYYGAGCSSDDLRKIVHKALTIVFPNAQIVVKHDSLASAFATYSGEPGISCILGTGSNSIYFDGESAYEEVPALGHILGDEASGCYFGKLLIRDFLYKKMPQKISNRFQKKYDLNKEEILENVMSRPLPNVYLASFASFLEEFRHEDYIKEMLSHGFGEFLYYHVECYKNYREVPVHFVGSIAYFYREELEKEMLRRGIKLGNIVRKPIHGLLDFHLQQKKAVS